MIELIHTLYFSVYILYFNEKVFKNQFLSSGKLENVVINKNYKASRKKPKKIIKRRNVYDIIERQ